MPYRADVDGLRAIAILSVILYHFRFSAVGGGFIGVDLFFVISGYLITGSSLRELSSWREVGDFYRRRIARILPLATFMMVGIAVATTLVYDVFERTELLRPAIPAALFVSNIFFWRHYDYFNVLAEINPYLHTWSLAIEEQFYIVIPLLLIFVRRRVPLFAVLVAGSFATMLLVRPQAAFFLLPARLWELGAGALVVYAPPLSRRLGGWMTAAGLGVFALGLAVTTPSLETSPLLRLLPVGAGVLTIWGGKTPNALSLRVLGNRPLAFIGEFSYSAYLLHWPVWVMIASVTTLSVAGRLGLVVVVLFASRLLYKFVEKPALRAVRGFSGRKVAFALGSMALVSVGSVWGLGRYVGAEEARVATSAPVRQLIRLTDSTLYFAPYSSGQCFQRENQSTDDYPYATCIPAPSGRKRVLLWGDSHIAHLMSGLEPEALKRHIDVFQASAASCPPLVDAAYGSRCAAFNAWVLEDVIPREKPDLVVVAARWGRDADRLGQDDFMRRLVETFDALGRHRVPVLLLGPSPVFSGVVPLLMADRLSKGEPADASYALAATTFDEMNTTLEAAAKKAGVAYYDVRPALECKNGRCLAFAGGEALFWDGSHMTPSGAAFSARPLADAIEAVLAPTGTAAAE